MLSPAQTQPAPRHPEPATRATSSFRTREARRNLQKETPSGPTARGTRNAGITDPQWNDLLTKTTFYKVGHLGSHNSTPVTFVENILPESPHDLKAMVCTRPTTKFKEIPRLPLLEKVSQKAEGRIARSDKKKTVADFRREGDAWTEVEVHL